MHKQSIFWGLAISFMVSTYAKLDLDRPEAKPNKELSSREKSRRDFWDFIWWESFGYQSILPKNEQFIRLIIKDLNMEDYCIEIRGMSNYAQIVIGRMNAFVVPAVFWGKKSHAYLYISEDWFNALTNDEKQALVRHELMHIKHNHALKKFIIAAASSTGLGCLEHLIKKTLTTLKIPYNQNISSNMTFARHIISLMIILKYSRDCEKEADIEGAKSMKSKKGYLALFKTMINNIRNPESKFWIKRTIANIFSNNYSVFSTHPELEERIDYIENLII